MKLSTLAEAIRFVHKISHRNTMDSARAQLCGPELWKQEHQPKLQPDIKIGPEGRESMIITYGFNPNSHQYVVETD